MLRRTVVAGLGLTFLGGAAASLARSPGDYGDGPRLYAALAQQPHTRLRVAGGNIDVVFADGAPGLDRGRVLAWIHKSAVAVSTYFGRFPVSQVGLLVIADDGGAIGSGTTYGFGAAAIRIHVGRAADDAAFKRDWVMVHEMTHLALPRVPGESLWVQEGNATYIEPIARAQAGQLDPAAVWRWCLEDMSAGQPRPGDRGLDGTPTHGRIYWGGAMFWLLADVQIRERTQGRKSLQDALRAINRQSGGITAEWSVDRVLKVGDEATGVPVLTALYARMGPTPVRVDLDALFGRLGMAERGGAVVFDDAAPLAGIRRRITAPPSRS
jgi:predicted metalloprotease with PDZ domain